MLRLLLVRELKALQGLPLAPKRNLELIGHDSRGPACGSEPSRVANQFGKWTAPYVLQWEKDAATAKEKAKEIAIRRAKEGREPIRMMVNGVSY